MIYPDQYRASRCTMTAASLSRRSTSELSSTRYCSCGDSFLSDTHCSNYPDSQKSATTRSRGRAVLLRQAMWMMVSSSKSK